MEQYFNEFGERIPSQLIRELAEVRQRLSASHIP
jgi:GTP-dependent phosphoenolpyruvate carboxykinase